MARPLHGAGHKVGWVGFITLPDEDKRELLDGQLVEMDVPTKLHEWIVSLVITLLGGWARARSAGVVLASGYKVRIRDDRGFMPDVQFFRTERVASLGMQGLETGAPDLAVEVISPASRRYDRAQKLDGYAAIGTAEYWVIDPDARTLERYLLDGRRLRLVETSDAQARFAPPSFPGLEIDLRELWTLPGQP